MESNCPLPCSQKSARRALSIRLNWVGFYRTTGTKPSLRNVCLNKNKTIHNVKKGSYFINISSLWTFVSQNIIRIHYYAILNYTYAQGRHWYSNYVVLCNFTFLLLGNATLKRLATYLKRCQIGQNKKINIVIQYKRFFWPNFYVILVTQFKVDYNRIPPQFSNASFKIIPSFECI